MSMGDRTSGSVKESVAGILNQALMIEYDFIMNYPRIIDQLTDIGRITDESVSQRLQRLGEDSVRHASMVMNLIHELGSEPHLDINISGRTPDVEAFVLEQLEKEKAAQSLYQQAKGLVEPESQAKGLLGKLKAMISPSFGNATERSKIIRTLEQMVTAEENHIMLIQNVMSLMNIQPKE